jgi:oligopeptide transport system substrate-binding protein
MMAMFLSVFILTKRRLHPSVSSLTKGRLFSISPLSKGGLRGVALIAALTSLLALAGCRSTGELRLNLPKGAMVLRTASEDDVPSLDPAIGYDTASWQFEQMIFDTLVRYGDADIELHPDVATSWEASSDARYFNFQLRRDVRFSNGRPLTAEDFRYSIERVLTPATRSRGVEYYRNLVGAAEFEAGRATHVSGIEVPDPYTIRFRLVAPDPIFLHKLAMPFAAAVPREVAEQWKEDFTRHPVGTGAFMLHEWRSGQRIVLVRNPHYFLHDAPRLDAIIELIGVNEELQWLKYEAGEIDFSDIPPAEFPMVMKTPRLKALTIKNLTVRTNYLGMNCQMAPFNDVRVRRAFNYAIDKNKLLALLNGRGVVARGVLPPSLPGYDAAVRGYPHDPAMARRMLEEAGVRDGFAPMLWFRSDQTMMRLAQSVQQDLALVGVNVVLKQIAWGPLLEAVRQPKTVPLFLLGWEADFPDPENFLDVLLSKKQWGSNNDAFFSNPQVEDLLTRARPLADLDKRFALYRQAESIVIEEAPWAFLYHPVSYVIRQPWVHNLVLNPMRPTRFEHVWLSNRRFQTRQ